MSRRPRETGRMFICSGLAADRDRGEPTRRTPSAGAQPFPYNNGHLFIAPHHKGRLNNSTGEIFDRNGPPGATGSPLKIDEARMSIA